MPQHWHTLVALPALAALAGIVLMSGDSADVLELLPEFGDLRCEGGALRPQLGDLVAGASQFGFLVACPCVDGVGVVAAATGQRER